MKLDLTGSRPQSVLLLLKAMALLGSSGAGNADYEMGGGGEAQADEFVLADKVFRLRVYLYIQGQRDTCFKTGCTMLNPHGLAWLRFLPS